MGRASISIAITSNFNSSGIDAAIRKAEQLATAAVHHQGKFGKAAVDMGASMGQASARLVSMGKAVADLGDKLTASVTIPMGLAATASVMAATKIDTAWYNVRKTVDMTEEGYQRLKDGAMALAETQPVSAETILNIESLGGQLGITNGQLENFAKIVSGLDIATNMNADEAATSLAQFRNIVQMSEDDLDNFASVVVDLGNHTATTEHDIMELALRFASAGHVAGMSNQEILGISASLAGLGMKAEAGGSALSRVINDIGIAVDTNGEHLEAWAQIAGKSVEDFKVAWKSDAAGTFEDILKGIASAGDEMNSVLDEAGVTQIRTSDAMRRLASSGDLMSESVERANQAWRENTALQREVDNRNESIQARWDTLVNRFTNDLARVGEPIAQMGLDAIEGLEPVIQGIGDLAQAFADAGPDVQQFAFNLAGVAMAAGPVLSIAGRVMQAFGNIGQAVGRGYQAWGRYSEGLHSTDMSMITTLSNSQDLASQMGVQRNAIVKAAGGVETFNVAYRKTTNAIKDAIEQEVRDIAYKKAYQEALDKGAESELKATEYAQKYAKSSKVTAKVTEQQKAAIKELNDSIDESNVATKLNVQNVTEQEKAAERASLSFGRMSDAIKGALIGIGGMALTGAAVAGITWLVTQFQMAAERAENLRLATDGLRESLGKTNAAADEGNRVWGSSIDTVDKAIESQAQLGEVFKQNNTAAETSIHTLDRAAEVIREYGNRSDLSASEQFKLRDAVDTVNEACGSQAAVLEDGTVALQDETGAWQENKQAILDNIEARKKQIRMEAAEANYKAAYEQELETKKALRDVQLEFNDAMERYRELSSREYITLSGDERTELRTILEKLGPLRERLEAAREAAQLAGESTEYYDRVLSQLSESSEAAAGSLEALLSSNTDFSVAFEGAEHSLSEFAAACQTLGINFDSLNVIGPEAANNIAAAFDGTAQSVITALQGAGDQGAVILENIGNNWYNSFSRSTQGIIGSVAAMKGMTLAELMALAADMGVRGEQATSAFMEGLDRGWSPERAAEIARQFDEAFDDGLDPEVAAQAAEAFVQALADGMSVEQALAKAQEIVDGVKSTLSGASFSEAAQGKGAEFFAALTADLQQSALDTQTVWSDTGQAIGKVLPDGTVQGINEGAPNIPPAIQNMLSGVDPILAAALTSYYTSGTQVPQQYGQGVQDNSGAVTGSGNWVVDLLLAALNGGVGQAEGVGTDTGVGYGEAVAQQGHVAEAAALRTLMMLLVIWLTGIEGAKQAGTKTGEGYAQSLGEASKKAITLADAASRATGTAFGAGRGLASSAGSALGGAFATAVWEAGSRAVAYARSVRSQVASIFSNMPTANIKVNVQRTVTTTPSTASVRAARYAALPSAVPVMPVPTAASASRAATVAESAVRRISGSGSSSSSGGVAATYTVSSAPAAAPVDYDTLYRVTESAVANGIKRAGGIQPVVELDGARVSRQLARSMDYELGRLDRMRG